MITVTIAGTPAEIATQAATLASYFGGKAAPAAAAPAASKPAAPAASKPAASKPVAPKPAPASTEGEINLNSLRDLGRACIKAGKNAEMKAALAALGADSITTADPAKYAELDAALRAIVNPGEEPAAEEDAL